MSGGNKSYLDKAELRNTLYIECMKHHRQFKYTINLFSAISENPDNKLNKLVPPIINSNYNLRKTRKFRVPVAKTKRFAESFIMKGAQLA